MNPSTVVSASVDASVAAKNERESKERRLDNMGKDQIYIETTMLKEKIEKHILNVMGKDYYYFNDGELYERKSRFSKGGFIWGVLGFVAFGWMVIMFLDMLMSWDFSFKLLWLSIPLGIVGGFMAGGDDIINYIQIKEDDKERGVLIDIYDGAGHRNIDEFTLKKLFQGIE